MPQPLRGLLFTISMIYITPINFHNGQTIAERIFSDFSNGQLIPNQKAQLSLRQLWINDPTGTTITTELVPEEMNYDFTKRFANFIHL
jgi:phenolic acid decarboxylase